MCIPVVWQCHLLARQTRIFTALSCHLFCNVSTYLGGCYLYPCPGVCAVSFAMCAVALLTGCAQPEVHGLLRSCVSRFPFRKDGKNLGT